MRKSNRSGILEQHGADRLEDRRLLSGFFHFVHEFPGSVGIPAEIGSAVIATRVSDSPSGDHLLIPPSRLHPSNVGDFAYAPGYGGASTDSAFSSPPPGPGEIAGRFAYGSPPRLASIRLITSIATPGSPQSMIPVASLDEAFGNPGVSLDAPPPPPRFGHPHGMDFGDLKPGLISFQSSPGHPSSDSDGGFVSAKSIDPSATTKSPDHWNSAPSRELPTREGTYGGFSPSVIATSTDRSDTPAATMDVNMQRPAPGSTDRGFAIPPTLFGQTPGLIANPSAKADAPHGNDFRVVVGIPTTAMLPASVGQGQPGVEHLSADHVGVALPHVGQTIPNLDNGALAVTASHDTIGEAMTKGDWGTELIAVPTVAVASPPSPATDSSSGEIEGDFPTLGADLIAELGRLQTTALRDSLEDFLRHYDESSRTLDGSPSDHVTPVLIVTSLVAAEVMRRRRSKGAAFVRSEPARGSSSSLNAFS